MNKSIFPLIEYMENMPLEDFMRVAPQILGEERLMDEVRSLVLGLAYAGEFDGMTIDQIAQNLGMHLVPVEPWIDPKTGRVSS